MDMCAGRVCVCVRVRALCVHVCVCVASEVGSCRYVCVRVLILICVWVNNHTLIEARAWRRALSFEYLLGTPRAAAPPHQHWAQQRRHPSLRSARAFAAVASVKCSSGAQRIIIIKRDFISLCIINARKNNHLLLAHAFSYPQRCFRFRVV